MNTINQLVFVMETRCVFIVEGNGFVNIYMNLTLQRLKTIRQSEIN
jgi:hypothetical protein